VKETNDRYIEIKEAINLSLTEIKNITALSNDMELKRLEVMDIVEDLSAIAEENAAGMEQASSAAERLLITMEENKIASEKLYILSVELKELVARFEV
jgi:methyl-accepting chemotaxis protein